MSIYENAFHGGTTRQLISHRNASNSMSLRDRVRNYRLYYKRHTLEVYRQAFKNYVKAWWFPFFGSGEFVPRDGSATVTVPRRRWPMLATASKLVLLGAQPRWTPEAMYVSYGDLTLTAPPTARLMATGLQSIFLDDVWRMKHVDLGNKIVVDIGAYVGDSSVAYALRGARVHAFEPLPLFQEYLRENARLNHVEHLITIHPVGLGDKDEDITNGSRLAEMASIGHGEGVRRSAGGNLETRITLVDAISYFRQHGIGAVDVLKLNCEGCEYALFKDTTILDYLRPRYLAMEFHQGGDQLFAFLTEHGYTVDWPSANERPKPKKGKLFAQRRA
jgi:FkbM family methyltransferase